MTICINVDLDNSVVEASGGIVYIHYNDEKRLLEQLNNIELPDDTQRIFFSSPRHSSQSVLPVNCMTYYLWLIDGELIISIYPKNIQTPAENPWFDSTSYVIGGLLILIAFLIIVFGLIAHRNPANFRTPAS